MEPLTQVQGEKVATTLQFQEDNKRLPKNRARIDVAADVVRSCRRKCAKGRMMLEANLNSVVATAMIGKLIGIGLLDSIHEDGNVFYLATPKGIEFIRKYSELLSMLSPELVPNNSSRMSRQNRHESLTF